MKLFLPFTPSAKATEELAVRVKRHLGLGRYDSVDPWTALPAVPARLLSLDDFPPDVVQVLRSATSAEWSAIGYGKSPRDGVDLVLLNPDHHHRRQKASLMEEIVHIVLGHPKVRLDFEGNGGWRRPFARVVEDEAYNVGAACILPYKGLFNAIRVDGRSAAAIAKENRVSEQYVEFRIKRAGLHRIYQKQFGPKK